MKKLFLFCFFASVCEFDFVRAQANDSLLAHAPLHIGNIWDYSGGYYFLGSFFYPSWRLVTAIKDSTHLNGKRYTVLERISYYMNERDQAGSLGRVIKEIFLQRVDSTTLNVYQVPPWATPTRGDEFLIDSLGAMEGDSFITNFGYDNILQLYKIATMNVLGKERVIRQLAVVNALVGFQFSTAEGLGEMEWSSGGEGEPSFRILDGAIIRGDTSGVLLRNRNPGLKLSEKELTFNKSIKKRRLFFVNANDGITIVDSVALNNELSFSSQPYYHGAGYANTIFSKGPFLVFPRDSIYLDIIIRESALSQTIEDTFSVYAKGINGKKLPPIGLPVRFDPTVSVQHSSQMLNQSSRSHHLAAYPNPATSDRSTRISFQLSKLEHVKIQIIDVTGRVINTLVDEQLNPGKYHSTFTPRGLPSGTYFVHLATLQQRETLKIGVMK